MTSASEFQDNMFVDISVTIASSGTTPAGGVRSWGLTPIGILFPSAMTSTSLTFTTDNGSGTQKTVNGLSMSITADNFVPFSSAWKGVQLGDLWKPVCDSAEGAERTLIIRCRKVG